MGLGKRRRSPTAPRGESHAARRGSPRGPFSDFPSARVPGAQRGAAVLRTDAPRCARKRPGPVLPSPHRTSTADGSLGRGPRPCRGVRRRERPLHGPRARRAGCPSTRTPAAVGSNAGGAVAKSHGTAGAGPKRSRQPAAFEFGVPWARSNATDRRPEAPGTRSPPVPDPTAQTRGKDPGPVGRAPAQRCGPPAHPPAQRGGDAVGPGAARARGLKQGCAPATARTLTARPPNDQPLAWLWAASQAVMPPLRSTSRWNPRACSRLAAREER